MTGKTVDLGRHIGLLWSRKFSETLVRERMRHPLLPNMDGIRRDLLAVRPYEPIPASVERGRRGREDSLKIYIDGRYVLLLSPREQGDSYRISAIYPMGFDSYDRIVRGALQLRAGHWQVYDDIGPVLRLRSGWDAIQDAWHGQTRSDTSPPSLDPSHADYLDRLEILIEQGRRNEAEDGASRRLVPYRRVTPVAAVRRSARSAHSFHLIDANELSRGTRVHIDGEPDLRGRIDRINEGVALVRFDTPVDFDRIPEGGSFAESPSLVTYDRQLKTVDLLREGRSRNPLLLNALVDHEFQRFTPANNAVPFEVLDPSQLSAFHKALEVPDLALIQGPPGTGKTYTIRQIVLARVSEGHKVLISSYTNRAVDNVLMELPDSLFVLRMGQEDDVSPDCQHLLLETRAAELQRMIRDRTEPGLEHYGVAGPDGAADALLRQLADDLRRLEETVSEARRSADAAAAREAAVTADLRQRLDTLLEVARQHDEQLSGCVNGLQRSERALSRAERAAGMPLIGWMFKRRAVRREEERSKVAEAVESAQAALNAIAQDCTQVTAEIEKVIATHPDLKAARRSHERDLAEQLARGQKAAKVAASLRQVLGVELPEITADPAALAAFNAAASAECALLRRRLDLLTSWRANLERRTEQLYNELVRYADVIGATCIGSAANKRLDEVDFDLAIIDEAGQIRTADTLVPLVRARRAVLVGDHVQLPPLPDDKLVAWAVSEHPDDPELARLITHSMFELLFPSMPEENRETLRLQRRMPESLAKFISDYFYGGQVKSESDVKRVHRDDLFAAPVAFVDTGKLKWAEKRERSPERHEGWPQGSFLNECEAELLTRLAAHYHSQHDDWAVILPYAAQIGLVSSLLVKRIGDEQEIARRVATVDSFQGGQHDTIICGFTRSNRKGNVGFLKEVRRSNVAFSRAKQRLILVGDLQTLLNAGDPEFRDLAEALHEYVRTSGDVREYREVMRHFEESA